MLKFYSLIRNTYSATKTTHTSQEYIYEELAVKRRLPHITNVSHHESMYESTSGIHTPMVQILHSPGISHHP